MNDDDSTPEPGRLRQRGTSLERHTLDSALADKPSAATREAAVSRVLAQHRAGKRSRIRAAVGALALAAATGLLLLHRAPPKASLAPEPRISVTPPPVPAPSSRGASEASPCADAPIAAGTTPLIDDFEDGDVNAPMLEHRAGQWLTFNDGSGPQFPRPGTLFGANRIPGGRGASQFGVHNVGGKFNKWGANFSLELSPRHCYDASAYGGIEFWARGSGEIRVLVQMNQVVSKEFGGTCARDCFDAHAKRIKLSHEFRRVVVRWDELRQSGFGPALPFDPHSLDSLQFGALPDQTPFDYWIDDVSFSLR